MNAEELAFYRNTQELDLVDTAYIYEIIKTDDNRGGESSTFSLWHTLPCRVTRPIQELRLTDTGFSPHTEERWDIAVSSKTMKDNNWRVLKGWKITVNNIDYIVLDGGEEQSESFLYHIAVERLY